MEGWAEENYGCWKCCSDKITRESSSSCRSSCCTAQHKIRIKLTTKSVKCSLYLLSPVLLFRVLAPFSPSSLGNTSQEKVIGALAIRSLGTCSSSFLFFLWQKQRWVQAPGHKTRKRRRKKTSNEIFHNWSQLEEDERDDPLWINGNEGVKWWVSGRRRRGNSLRDKCVCWCYNSLLSFFFPI